MVVPSGTKGYHCGEKWVKVMFIGQYKYNLDDKGRIVLPSEYRRQLGSRVVINKGIENCINLYSEQDWDKQVSKVMNLDFTHKDNRAFNRYFLSSAFVKEIDNQGRIKLEDNLVEFAKITKECVIVGAGNVVEIWSLDAWRRQEEERDNNFENISESIVLPQ